MVSLLTLTACPADDSPGDDEIGADTDTTTGIDISTTDTGESTDTGGTTTDTGDSSDTGDTSSDTGETGEPPPPSECGNGVVEPGETCDDGNLESGDGCASGCSIEGQIIMCGNKLWACGDGVDNDGDGKVDTDDVDCISPCDDDEGSFETDIPGVNNDCKQDCFFDGDSGAGNDNCEWNLQCDELNPGAQIGCEYDPGFGMCMLEMPPTCLEVCVPLVPNGCDCFGCCEIQGEFYYLDSSPECGIDNLEACETCTFFEGCNNPCMPEDCELCFGQDPGELPEECGGEPTCPDNLSSCQSSVDCDEGLFCQTGCCVPVIIE